MIEDSELAQSLLESGLVDRDRLVEVARHRSPEQNLYQTLLSCGAVEERALVRLVGKLLNVPSVRLDRVVIAPEVLELVSASIANRNKVIPLSIEQDGPHRRLVLGMIDPIDVLAMDEVSTHTGIDIRPVLVGPTDLESALIKVYNRRVVETIEPHKPFADVSDLAVEALDHDEWEELFDSAQALALEDSSVISQEMRDRPVSGVFEVLEGEDEDDLPMIDIIDMIGLAKPATADVDLLDDWEVDDVITHSSTNKAAFAIPGISQIVSAADAMHLFSDSLKPPPPVAPSEQSRASTKVQVVPQALPAYPSDDGADDDVGEPTEKKSIDDLSTDSESLEKTGRTSIGAGPGGQEDTAGSPARRAPKAKTARTDRLKQGAQPKQSNTDYGELGRQLLQSEIARDEAAKGAVIALESTEDQRKPTSLLVEGTVDEDTNVHLIAIPEDVDTRLLLRSLLSHLRKAGLLDKDTISEMIQTARPKA